MNAKSRAEAHAALMRAVLDKVADITLTELKARLAKQGASTSVAALRCYFRRHKITRKKRLTRKNRTVPTP